MPGMNHNSKGDKNEIVQIRREIVIRNDTRQRYQKQQVNRSVNQRTVRRDAVTPQTRIILNRVSDDDEIVLPSNRSLVYNSSNNNQRSITVMLVLLEYVIL